MCLGRLAGRIGILDGHRPSDCVWVELSESLSATRLGHAAKHEPCNAVVQRLGWMLENLDRADLTGPLHKEVSNRKPSYARLNSALSDTSGVRNIRWNIIENDQPESEL